MKKKMSRQEVEKKITELKNTDEKKAFKFWQKNGQRISKLAYQNL